jgi:hypothetical protein
VPFWRREAAFACLLVPFQAKNFPKAIFPGRRLSMPNALVMGT